MPPRLQYRWDPVARRYRGPNGRYIAIDRVRAAVDYAIRNAENPMRTASVMLREGKINLEDWQIAMRHSIKRTHLHSAAAAAGGWEQMRATDFARLGPILREQYAYLRNFAVQIEKGLPLGGGFLARVELYGEAARGTYHYLEELLEMEAGRTQYRNRLRPAEHCSDCVAATQAGWVKIGTLTPIGQRRCRVRCKCYFEYRTLT